MDAGHAGEAHSHPCSEGSPAPESGRGEGPAPPTGSAAQGAPAHRGKDPAAAAPEEEQEEQRAEDAWEGPRSLLGRSGVCVATEAGPSSVCVFVTGLLGVRLVVCTFRSGSEEGPNPDLEGTVEVCRGKDIGVCSLLGNVPPECVD